MCESPPENVVNASSASTARHKNGCWVVKFVQAGFPVLGCCPIRSCPLAPHPTPRCPRPPPAARTHRTHCRLYTCDMSARHVTAATGSRRTVEVAALRFVPPWITILSQHVLQFRESTVSWRHAQPPRVPSTLRNLGTPFTNILGRYHAPCLPVQLHKSIARPDS